MKLDRPNRCFVIHPHLFTWIESDLESWLGSIETDLQGGRYSPKDCFTCYEPKGNWMVRPGAVLDLTDELVFNALIGSFQSQISKTIGSAQGDPDIAYQLQKDPTKDEWVRAGFLVQKQWREKSLAKLGKGIQFVVFADIAAFYENVDFTRMSYDLRSIGVDQNALGLLMKCLNRWAHPREKGIPQGYSGSDVLAKLYLSSVDKALKNAGFKHLRYVDDIRIFCRTSLEAKRALLLLNELLRKRGLNLQTSKTELLQRPDARRKIDGVTPTIEAIQSQLSEEMRTVWAVAGAYGTLAEIDLVIDNDPNAPPLEVLERTFHEYFSTGSHEKFNKTLLHYVLTRLGKTKSKAAVTYCIELLSGRPEETTYALRYLAQIELNDDDVNRILDYAASADAIYDYQLYQILRWFWTRSTYPERLIPLCRNWAADRNRDAWLRTYSIAILGANADATDLEELKSRYGGAAGDIEKSEIVAALAKMESSQRNAFYGQVKSDGFFVRQAVTLARFAAA